MRGVVQLKFYRKIFLAKSYNGRQRIEKIFSNYADMCAAKYWNCDTVHMFIAKIVVVWINPKKLLSFQAIRQSSSVLLFFCIWVLSYIKIDPHTNQPILAQWNLCHRFDARNLRLKFWIYFDHEISLFCRYFIKCLFSILSMVFFYHFSFTSRFCDEIYG